MFSSPRAQLGSIVSLAADVSLTLLSERVHRGSLANARGALDEKRDYDLGSARMLREFEDRARRGFGQAESWRAPRASRSAGPAAPLRPPGSSGREHRAG